MIERDRPICAMDNLIKPNYSDPHRDWSKYTLVGTDQEWRDEYDHDHQWESCNAWWSVNNPDAKDGDIFQKHYVRCMEPATWWVGLSGGGLANETLTFCDFHKPRVKENV